MNPGISMTPVRSCFQLSALTVSALCLLLAAIVACPALAAETSPAPLLSNGDFQTDADGDNVPDGWAAPKGGAGYASEGTNRYLHLVSPKPDEMVMTYRQIRI